jgi:hypothetical protein
MIRGAKLMQAVVNASLPIGVRQVTPQTIQDAFDRETLFRVSYVPYIIFEVAWDYADSMMNLCASLRIHETKKLCRAIRELRKRFDSYRERFIDLDSRNKEFDHMIQFEEESKRLLSGIYKGIKTTIRKQRPGVVDDWLEMVACVYMCEIIFSALFRYARDCDKLIESRCGRANHSILPDEMFQISRLIPEFRGDVNVAISLRPAYVAKIYKQITIIELIDKEHGK